MRLLLASLALSLTACASNKIIRDEKYQPSLEAYNRQEPAEALKRFPNGEDHGFITSTEKAWLGLWDGQLRDKDLAKLAPSFDERHFVSLTREAGVFLFQESEEGYVPSEHEAVVFHLLRGILFLRANNREDAAVELRMAGYTLDRTWDDPALRLWLGTLWTAVGDWNEAQVDFRRANELAPNAQVAKLSRLKQPPRHLGLNFYGNAPLLKWPEGQYTPEFLEDKAPMGDGYSTHRWFLRHADRNTALRDALLKSNFMAQYLGGKALTLTERGMGKSITGAIKITAIAIGAALVAGVFYLAAQSNLSGEGISYLAGGAIGVGAGIWKAGGEFDTAFTRGVDADEERKLKSLRVYRMVRFLPSWITVDTTEPAPGARTLQFTSKNGGNQVWLTNYF